MRPDELASLRRRARARSLTDYRRTYIDAGLDPYLDLNLDTYTIENEAESHLRAAGLFRPEETTEQMVERALAEQRRDEIIPRPHAEYRS